MRIKEELEKLRDKMVLGVTSDSVKDVEKGGYLLDYGALGIAISRLPQENDELEQKNETLKNQLKVVNSEEKIKFSKANSKTHKMVVLDDKVDEFIKWFSENRSGKNATKQEKNSLANDMRNFIEKMAVWYELRYPDYEINRLMPGSTQEQTSINKVMFEDNQYINDMLDEDSLVKDLDWSKFYNVKVFINSLTWSEMSLFLKPRYQECVYWDSSNSKAHLHLTSKGVVRVAEMTGLKWHVPGVSNENLEGMNIKEVVAMLKEKGVVFPANNDFEKAIKDYDEWCYQKEEMLNSVMYRIIERGGNRFGPRRAFLFAKEFGRNIDIPMAYGVDRTDPGLRLFINEYIKAGGSENLLCYNGYGSRASKYEKIPTVTVQELLKTQSNSASNLYTPEETELHQRLVNALSRANQEEKNDEKEEVKQLRKR